MIEMCYCCYIIYYANINVKYCKQYNSYEGGGSIMKKYNLSIIVCVNAGTI